MIATQKVQIRFLGIPIPLKYSIILLMLRSSDFSKATIDIAIGRLRPGRGLIVVHLPTSPSSVKSSYQTFS